MFLGNLFQESREDAPEEKLARIQRFLSTLTTEVSDSWEEAAPRLVPLVRLATFGVGLGVIPLSRPFVPFVRVLIGVDSEHSVAIVDRTRVDEWEQSVETIFAMALSTLAQHVRDDDIEPYDPEAEYPIWHVTRGDSYECSRLALPGFLESFRGRVSGNPIAIVPNRSTLIVSGDGDARAIARLARSAEAEFIASSRAVSAAVYTVDASGDVVPFHLAERARSPSPWSSAVTASSLPPATPIKRQRSRSASKPKAWTFSSRPSASGSTTRPRSSRRRRPSPKA